MSNTPSTAPTKGSKRLILKITALSLSSLCAFAVIAYISLNNYKTYNNLVDKQQRLTKKVSNFTKLQQIFLNLETQMTQNISLSSFTQIQGTITEAEVNLSGLKNVDNPLLTKAFSQFLEVKKQTRTLKSFLAKKEVISKQPNTPEKKLLWLTEQSHSQQKRISNELTPLLK